MSLFQCQVMPHNKYLNKGYPGTPSWECRNVLADLIVSYLDNYERIEDQNAETAVFMLEEFLKGGYGDSTGEKVIREGIGNHVNSETAYLFRKWSNYVENDKTQAVKILIQFNTGIFAPKSASSKDR